MLKFCINDSVQRKKIIICTDFSWYFACFSDFSDRFEIIPYLGIRDLELGGGPTPHKQLMMEKNPRSTLFYVAVKLIDVKTKYNKDRRGLEQEEVEVLLFEWTPWEIASIALVF